jgi:hypothetical protein
MSAPAKTTNIETTAAETSIESNGMSDLLVVELSCLNVGYRSLT